MHEAKEANSDDLISTYFIITGHTGQPLFYFIYFFFGGGGLWGWIQDPREPRGCGGGYKTPREPSKLGENLSKINLPWKNELGSGLDKTQDKAAVKINILKVFITLR